MEWHSFHAWCHSLEAQERLAVHLRINDRVDSGWFFIKYWMGGPHLRIRTTNRVVHEELMQEAREWLIREEIPSLDRDAFYSGVNLSGEPVNDTEELPWFPSGTVREMPYHREIDRYLGLRHMPASERVFQHSSELAVLIFTTPHSRHVRLTLGALAMWGLAEAHGFATVNFFRRYAKFWEQIAGGTVGDPLSSHAATAICEKIVSGEVHFAAVDRCIASMTAELAPVASEASQDDTALVIASHMHMTNNRLSVLPAAEAALAWEFCRVLTGRGL